MQWEAIASMQAFPVPYISVIVPSYNKPQFLPECLESIRAQTFRGWECIVVSDGSPRVEEIRSIVAAMRDERFRLVEHKENRGLAAARNTGIREARADLVICVDEDDRLLPECLEEEFEALTKGEYEIVCCTPVYFGGRSGLYQTRIPMLKEILSSQPLPPCGFLMKKSVWKYLGGWDEHPILRLGREDHEWWIRAVKHGVNIGLLNRPLYQYRVPANVEDENASLNLQARKNEVRIRCYIVRKHANLYRLFPEERSDYLRQAFLKEAASCLAQRKSALAVVRLWGAALLFRNEKDFRVALKATMSLLIGREIVRRLLSLGGVAGAGKTIIRSFVNKKYFMEEKEKR